MAMTEHARGRATRPDDEARADRFEAMLEARFAPEARRAFARELEANDRQGAPGGADLDRAREGLRYHGDLPGKVREILSDWLPLLMVFAERRGLALRASAAAVHFYSRSAFETGQGGVPAGLRLPASSFLFDGGAQRYVVRVVLPDELASLQGLLGVARAALVRLYGDIFIREVVRPLEPYRKAGDREASGFSAGLSEILTLLPEAPQTTPQLERAVHDYARVAGINPRRQAGLARKGFFRELREAFEQGRLDAEREALAEDAFAAYLEAVRGDLTGGIERTAHAAEALNRQLNYLPPEQQEEYGRLRSQRPLAFLRAAQVRLAFLLEALGAVTEAFETMDGGTASDPLLDERLAGYLDVLEHQGLARPYLVPGVQLSDVRERQLKAFPLEVHSILQRLPAPEDPGKAFRTLSRRLENALHQRLCNALVYLRHWVRVAERGQTEEFRATATYGALKGLVANFGFRLPLLEVMHLRVGVVLDIAESETSSEEPAAFPWDPFVRAWGQFVAHALTVEFFRDEMPLRGFDPARYWAGVAAQMRRQAAAGEPSGAMLYLLQRLYAGNKGAGLTGLVAMLREGDRTFRFAVERAALLHQAEHTPEFRLAQLEDLSGAVLRAWASRRQNAIVPAAGET